MQKIAVKMSKQKISELLNTFRESDDNKLVNIYMSGVYLLLNIQQDWWDEAEEIMIKYNVMNQEFKHRFNRVKKELNGFELQLRPMIKNDLKKMEMIKDIEMVRDVLTKFIMGYTREEYEQSKKK